MKTNVYYVISELDKLLKLDIIMTSKSLKLEIITRIEGHFFEIQTNW